jgi:hypothetical protein
MALTPNQRFLLLGRNLLLQLKPATGGEEGSSFASV